MSSCLSLYSSALQPGSTGHLLRGGMSSRQIGPSSRILAGPVSGEIGFSYCHLSHLFYLLSVLFLVCCSVCSGVLYVGSTSGSSSGTVVSFHPSPPSWRQVLFTQDLPSNIPSKASMTPYAEIPLEAINQVLQAGTPNPPLLVYAQTRRYSLRRLLHDQTEGNHTINQTQLKSSTLEASASGLGLLYPPPRRKISATSLPTSTDHRRRHLITLHKPSDVSTVTTQDLDQLKARPPITSDEVNLNSSRSGDGDTLISTFNYSINYFLYFEESQASATEDFCQKEEKITANSLRNALSTTRELGEQLLCLSNPNHNRVSELSDLQSLSTAIRSHRQTGLTSYWRELTTPPARTSLIKDSSNAYSTINATSSSSRPTFCHILGNNYYPNLHLTVAMPNNSGNLHDWTTACASCKSTSKDKKELNLIQGLHSLRKSTTQPTLSLLLHLPAGTSDFCLELRADLQEKHSRTQEFYALVCWNPNNLSNHNYARIILNRLLHFLEEPISSLKTTNTCKFDYLFILVYSLCDSKLQASWAQNTTMETVVLALSQLIPHLRCPSETLHAFGAPTSVSSLQVPPRKSSNKKTDKETSFPCQQKSYACSTSALLPPLQLCQQKSYACSTSALLSPLQLCQQKSYACSATSTPARDLCLQCI